MTIGILTFSSANNFGAILQCYALWKTLSHLGYDVKVIDYCPDYLSPFNPKLQLRDFLSLRFWDTFKKWDFCRYWDKIAKVYRDFKTTNIRMTPAVSTNEALKRLTSSMDVVIVGSDQVWNSKFNGNDVAWYGFYSSGTKWITYGASCGDIRVWNEKYNNRTINLENFSALSVREQELLVAIKSLCTDKTVTKVVDPSLLADREIWHKWTSPVEEGDYVIVYQARECDDVFRVARELSNQLNSRIIVLDFYQNVRAEGLSTRITSPSEFISLIKNAKCVVTTSFHGTAFSILLHTPFYTLRLNDGADERIYDLLRNVGLLDRFISIGSPVLFDTVNFSHADIVLNNMRLHSLNYLKDVLQ